MHVRLAPPGDGDGDGDGESAAGRRRGVDLDSYRAYAKIFVDEGGTRIYVVADDGTSYDDARGLWPPELAAPLIGRPAHHPGPEEGGGMGSRDRSRRRRVDTTGVLVDVYAMARCGLLLHAGYSTTTEAAMFVNPSLHDRSIDLLSSLDGTDRPEGGGAGGGGDDEREAMFRLMAREVLGGGGEPKTSSRGADDVVAGKGR
jgi:hypothetical protein